MAGFDRGAAQVILETDVAPTFHANLLSVAGEWAGWREDDVRALILEHLGRNRLSRATARLGAQAARRMYQDAWTEVARRLD